MIVVGGYRTSSITTRTFDDDGNADWTADHGDRVLAVAIDADGNVYTGGLRTSNLTTRKYNSSGSLQWSADHGAQVNGIAVDDSGNVYTCGARTSSITTRKYDSAGTLQWSVDHGANVNAIAVDSSGNVYTGGVRTGVLTTDRTTRKYNSAGTLQWSADHGNGGTVSGIAVDSSGNVYTAGNVISSNTTRKYDSSGALQWSINHGAWVWGIAVDDSGNVYTSGIPSSSLTTRKYNSSGTLQWSADHGDDARGIAVDSSGNVYTTGDLISSVSTRKYDSSGTPVWTADHYFMLAIAWRGLALSTTVPSLALPILLGTPFSTFFHSVQALALPLALGVPNSKGATAPDFSDLGATVAALAADDPATWGPYTGLSSEALSTMAVPIYTGVVAGMDSSMQRFVVASLQCNRRVNASSWVVATVPYDAALSTALAAMIGGEVLIDAGFRLPQGVEASGPFLRMTLTAVASEEAPYRGNLRLTGRVINPPFTATTRTLVSITRIQTDGDRRTVTCAVDPLLRPNDTAVAGAESFAVGAIDYRIDPWQATMTVTEALNG